MPKERMFYAPGVGIGGLADELDDYLESREFESQVMPVEGGGLLVQARREEGWRQVLGMSLATNIVLNEVGPNIKVECGQGKWLDKAVVGAVGLLILWPAMIPAALGAWQQSKLPEEIFDRVEAYISRQPTDDESTKAAEVPTWPESVDRVASTQCPSCGGAVPVGAKFCQHCGAAIPDLAPAASTQGEFCAACGAELAEGSKFCSECGAKTVA